MSQKRPLLSTPSSRARSSGARARAGVGLSAGTSGFWRALGPRYSVALERLRALQAGATPTSRVQRALQQPPSALLSRLRTPQVLSLIHISEPTRLGMI